MLVRVRVRGGAGRAGMRQACAAWRSGSCKRWCWCTSHARSRRGEGKRPRTWPSPTPGAPAAHREADPLLAGLDWVDQTVAAAEAAAAAATGSPSETATLTLTPIPSESMQGVAAAQAGASGMPSVSSNPHPGDQGGAAPGFAVQSSLCQASMNWALQAILPLWLELREDSALGTIETEGPKVPHALLRLISQGLPRLEGAYGTDAGGGAQGYGAEGGGVGGQGGEWEGEGGGGGEGEGEGERKEGVCALGLHLLHLLAGLGWGWALEPLRQAGMGPMEVDAADALGCTALHWAAAYGRSALSSSPTPSDVSPSYVLCVWACVRASVLMHAQGFVPQIDTPEHAPVHAQASQSWPRAPDCSLSVLLAPSLEGALVLLWHLAIPGLICRFYDLLFLARGMWCRGGDGGCAAQRGASAGSVSMAVPVPGADTRGACGRSPRRPGGAGGHRGIAAYCRRPCSRGSLSRLSLDGARRCGRQAAAAAAARPWDGEAAGWGPASPPWPPLADLPVLPVQTMGMSKAFPQRSGSGRPAAMAVAPAEQAAVVGGCRRRVAGSRSP